MTLRQNSSGRSPPCSAHETPRRRGSLLPCLVFFGAKVQRNAFCPYDHTSRPQNIPSAVLLLPDLTLGRFTLLNSRPHFSLQLGRFTLLNNSTSVMSDVAGFIWSFCVVQGVCASSRDTIGFLRLSHLGLSWGLLRVLFRSFGHSKLHVHYL